MPLSVVAALLGAVDTTEFLARRPRLFRDKPGRAGGSVAFLLLWVLLAGAALRSGTGARRTSRGVAAVLAAGNAAMLGVHLKHRIASPRVFVAAVLSVVCLSRELTRT